MVLERYFLKLIFTYTFDTMNCLQVIPAAFGGMFAGFQ